MLRTQRPLYARNLMADKQNPLPLFPTLKNYLSLKSSALHNAGLISVMMSIASLMGSAAPAQTVLDPHNDAVCIQNGYGATRVRILHRSVGTLVSLVITGVMLVLTLEIYPMIRKTTAG